MSQANIQKIYVRLIKLCWVWDYIEIFIYLFNSEYNMPVLGFTSRPTKYPDLAIMGKKGSWKPHVLHLGAKWELDLTWWCLVTLKHMCLFPPWQVKSGVKGLLLLCLCSKMTYKALMTEREGHTYDKIPALWKSVVKLPGLISGRGSSCILIPLPWSLLSLAAWIENSYHSFL